MLKIIRRVLRLSGNLSKRIWGSFICGFLESMFGLLPIAAVFLVLIELQNGQPITGQTCGRSFTSISSTGTSTVTSWRTETSSRCRYT